MRRKYKRFLKAAYINYDEDYCGCGSGTFTKPTITTPIIVITGNTAIIACAVNGATIYYTLDGSTPTSSSTLYTGTITLTLSCTIKAIAVKLGMTDSAIAEESYVKPITYLTQWKIVGNSEVVGKEIWSCGEYNPIDGKYHILVQPLGGSIADIALTEPLRKVNDVADTIEFPSDTEGKALVTRPLKSINLYDYINSISRVPTYYTPEDSKYAYKITRLSDVLPPTNNGTLINGLCSAYIVGSRHNTYLAGKTCISVNDAKDCHIYDSAFNGADDIDAFKAYITEVKPEFIYELATPTTELVDAPQIAEADSYTCEISQGGKAVSWSSFETE